MTTREQYYKIGQQAAKDGIKNMRQMVDYNFDLIEYASTTELVFVEAGLLNKEMPYKVTGWRYGNIPERGFSWNYAEDRPESGVSVMEIDGGQSAPDALEYAFFAHRPIVKITGYLNTVKTGSDGEPLLLDAKLI